MQPLNAAGRTYEVERRAYHAARPGFRIAEMQIGPTQRVPWHYHTEAQDTFYVINGTIRVFMREPEEEVCLKVGMTYSVRPVRLTLSLMPVTPQPYFWSCRGWASTILSRSPDDGRLAANYGESALVRALSSPLGVLHREIGALWRQ